MIRLLAPARATVQVPALYDSLRRHFTTYWLENIEQGGESAACRLAIRRDKRELKAFHAQRSITLSQDTATNLENLIHQQRIEILKKKYK